MERAEPVEAFPTNYMLNTSSVSDLTISLEAMTFDGPNIMGKPQSPQPHNSDVVDVAITRQRHISECSDDFIIFQYDDDVAANRLHIDWTTDVVFESDDSDDESSDSNSNDWDIEPIRPYPIESSPSDSNFKTKKVSIFQFTIFSQISSIHDFLVRFLLLVSVAGHVQFMPTSAQNRWNM